MTIVLWALFILVVGLLLLVASMRPNRPHMSSFELTRRAKLDDVAAQRDLARLDSLDNMMTLQRIVSTLLLVITVILSVTLFDWLLGIIIATVIALEYPAVARFRIIGVYGQKLYDYIEPSLLKFSKNFSNVFVLFRGRQAALDPPVISSREELEHSILNITSLDVSKEDKHLLVHGLSFGSRLVSEIMTPRSMISAVDDKELLGPLALDELHKTGHSRFPVMEGDVDHIVGILYIQDLLTVTQSKSPIAAKAMNPKVFYIHESQTLQHALSAFIRTHHHLFIVVNEYRETVGVLSLEDVIEALIGRKIIDEFDTHDDLRTVAARNPHKNNSPENSNNV